MTLTHRHRIVVVENDQATRELLQSRLNAAGYDVDPFDSGQAAFLDVSARRPDLVILDLKLPDMHGYDVCEKLRKLYSSWAVPILMLTAMDRPIDELRGFGRGADAYMTKPYDPGELLKTVDLLIGHTTLT